MNAVETLLKAVRERLEKATPGPWHLRPHAGNKNLATDVCKIGRPDTLATTSFFGWSDEEMCSNAALIAHAPTDLAKLLEIIACYEAVLEVYSSPDSWASYGQAHNDQEIIAREGLKAAERIAGIT